MARYRLIAVNIEATHSVFVLLHSYRLKALFVGLTADTLFASIPVSNIHPYRYRVFLSNTGLRDDINAVSSSIVRNDLVSLSGYVYLAVPDQSLGDVYNTLRTFIGVPYRDKTVSLIIRNIRVEQNPLDWSSVSRGNQTIIVNPLQHVDSLADLRRSIHVPDETIVCVYSVKGKICGVEPTYSTSRMKPISIKTMYGSIVDNPPYPFKGYDDFKRYYNAVAKTRERVERIKTSRRKFMSGGRRGWSQFIPRSISTTV